MPQTDDADGVQPAEERVLWWDVPKHRTEKPSLVSIQGSESADRLPKPATAPSQLQLVIVKRPRREGSSWATLFMVGVGVPITLAS
jgi:hypothetical protein